MKIEVGSCACTSTGLGLKELESAKAYPTPKADPPGGPKTEPVCAKGFVGYGLVIKGLPAAGAVGLVKMEGAGFSS